jgi:hypothetical protein
MWGRAGALDARNIGSGSTSEEFQQIEDCRSLGKGLFAGASDKLKFAKHF